MARDASPAHPRELIEPPAGPDPTKSVLAAVLGYGWIVALVAIAATIGLIYQRERAFEVISFEYRPRPSADEPDWQGERERWLPAPYPTPAIPLNAGFEFQARIDIRDLGVVDRISPHADDVLAELAVNGHPIEIPQTVVNGPQLDRIVQDGFRRYATMGRNVVTGSVNNDGGPTHFELELPDQELFGPWSPAIASALVALALWVVLYRFYFPEPPVRITVVALTALVLLFFKGFLLRLPYYGRGDWDQHFWFLEAIRRAVVEYRSLPLWNPYSDGGIPIAGYPQSYAMNPLMPLTWVLGSVVGAKVMVVAFACFGTIGMWFLGRELGLRWAAAMAGAVLFQFNGAIVQHLSEGHFAHQVNNWVPWSLLFFFRSRYRWNSSLLISGILLAAVVLSGEVYTLVFAAAGLGVWCALEAVRVRSARPLIAFVALLVVAAAVSAPRALPIVEYGLLCARQHDPIGGFSWPILWTALFGRKPTYFMPPAQVHLWHEYGSYVGPLTVALAALGALVTIRRSWPALIAFSLMLWLSLGQFGPFNLWEAASRLPLMSSLRAPSRWNYAFLFFLIWFAALGVHRIAKVLPRLAFAVPLLLFVDLMVVCSPLYNTAFDIAVTPPLVSKGYRLRRNVEGTHPGRYSGLYEQVMGDVGVIEAYNPVAPRRYAFGEGDPGYRGLVFLDGTQGQAELSAWTPREVRVRVTAQGSGVLVYDQNFFPGWYAYVRGERRPAFPVGGLVATGVDPGADEVTLRYEAPLVWVGLAIATSMILAAWLLSPTTRRA